MATPLPSEFFRTIKQNLLNKKTQVDEWFRQQEKGKELPLYSSMDIRDAGFKMTVIDTNLFPAGFNNLCDAGLKSAIPFIRLAVSRRVVDCQNILIVSEEHTRNLWYLENIRVLQELIEQAGYHTKVATFLDDQPQFCRETGFRELETALGQKVVISCLKKILKEMTAGHAKFDLILLNNDLTGGIPELLEQFSIPIYPSLQAGWHSRLKSRHFAFTDELMVQLAALLGMDPWFLSSFWSVAQPIDIEQHSDRERLADMASNLFQKIATKHQEYRITDKPYIIVKSDFGTYGRSVLAIEDPREILTLNHRQRGDLRIGKGSRIVNQFLLQEGVATSLRVNGNPAEICVYQVENQVIGGFYRINSQKSDRDNLNSKGMNFKKMCPLVKDCGVCDPDENSDKLEIYKLLARLAGLAAQREVQHLESVKK